MCASLPARSDGPGPGFTAQLREPLAEMFALLPLLARQQGEAADPLPMLQLNRCCYRLLRSTSLLAQFSALPSGAAAACCTDLTASVESVCQAAAQILLPGQPPILFHGPRRPLPVGCAPQPLAALTGALLANALRFTREGNFIQVQLQPLSGSALLQVRDRGTGIRPQVLRHIFEPFYSADPSGDRGPQPGAGLGLTFARLLADRLGGRISIESRFGEGCCVAVSLPVHRKAPGICLAPTAADHLLDRYSPLYAQLCDFCRLPDPV